VTAFALVLLAANDQTNVVAPAPIPTEAIEYHDVVFDRDFGTNARWYSDYSGRWPDDEIDDRWDALYNRESSFPPSRHGVPS
jgi:hypothetical protein